MQYAMAQVNALAEMGTKKTRTIGWLVVLGLTALCNSISVYIGPSSNGREKEDRKDR